jgi:hypothetical protein
MTLVTADVTAAVPMVEPISTTIVTASILQSKSTTLLESSDIHKNLQMERHTETFCDFRTWKQ